MSENELNKELNIEFTDDISTENVEIPYPDGIGMKIEEVIALLAKQNETIVTKDDPILLTVTILNAFLQENDKMNTKYLEALKMLFAELANDTVKNTEEHFNSINKKLETMSVENMDKVSSRISSFSASLWIATGIMAVSALINVAVFVLK